MTSTVSDIKERILEILRIDASIKKAAMESLRGSNTADAPFAVIETGAAQYAYDEGNDTRERVRDFSITIFVQPVMTGAEFEAEEACDPFFELVPDLFDQRPSLTVYDVDDEKDVEPLDNVKQAYLVSDGGYDTLKIGNVLWACAAGFVLRVELKYHRTQEV